MTKATFANWPFRLTVTVLLHVVELLVIVSVPTMGSPDVIGGLHNWCPLMFYKVQVCSLWVTLLNLEVCLELDKDACVCPQVVLSLRGFRNDWRSSRSLRDCSRQVGADTAFARQENSGCFRLHENTKTRLTPVIARCVFIRINQEFLF